MLRHFGLRMLSLFAGGLLLSGCFEQQSQLRWQDQTIVVQVGEVRYELEPGYARGLASMKNREINKALAEGLGTHSAPLKLRSFRIAAYEEESKGLDFDVGIAESTDDGPLHPPATVRHSFENLDSVEFIQDENDVVNRQLDSQANLRFTNGELLEVPMRCRVVFVKSDLRNVFCSFKNHLLYSGNRLAVRARSGDRAEIAKDIKQGLELVAKIEQN